MDHADAVIPGRRDAEGRLYVTADLPDPTSSFNGGVAVRSDGVVHALLDSTDVDPHNVTPPAISGTGDLGSTLTATPGVWTGSPTPTVTGQWYANNVLIPGAIDLTFDVTTAQMSNSVVYRETATNTGGVVTADSNAIQAEAAPLGPLFGVQIDDYQGFSRAYWNPSFGNIYDGLYHQMKFLLKLTPPNPGGTIFPDTDALRANTGTSAIMWWDNNGTLGKIILRQNNQLPETEMTVGEMADAIDAAAGFIVKPEGNNLVIVGIMP